VVSFETCRILASARIRPTRPPFHILITFFVRLNFSFFMINNRLIFANGHVFWGDMWASVFF